MRKRKNEVENTARYAKDYDLLYADYFRLCLYRPDSDSDYKERYIPTISD